MTRPQPIPAPPATGGAWIPAPVFRQELARELETLNQQTEYSEGSAARTASAIKTGILGFTSKLLGEPRATVPWISAPIFRRLLAAEVSMLDHQIQHAEPWAASDSYEIKVRLLALASCVLHEDPQPPVGGVGQAPGSTHDPWRRPDVRRSAVAFGDRPTGKPGPQSSQEHL